MTNSNPMNSDPTNTLDLGPGPVGKNARNRFAISGRAVPVALWAAAAVAVTAIATFAITAAFGSGGPTLTPEQVAQALATGPTTTGAGRTATAPATTAPTATTNTDLPAFATDAEVFQTTPGTVAVQCEGSLATLVSWSPNPGYRVDDVVRGPAAKASVWFESDVADDVLVVAECRDGAPSITEQPEFDDHGGGDDDNSGPGGGGGSGRD
jgi:hypothetical protein